MKKFLAIIAAIAVIAATFVACSSNATNNEGTESDLAYVQGKGELVIGITYFQPMDYIDDATGELTGFEVEFGKAVCEKLGVTPKFQEISWDAKETELAAKNIDCIWNGLTITPERQENMLFSDPYMDNRQIVFVKVGNDQGIMAEADLAGKSIGTQAGSTAETYIDQTEELKSSFKE